jgi:ribonuclease BN (tRNA processing enzyme)
MIAMRRFGVDPNRIGAIVLSHLHADHYGGLPTFILDGQLVSGRIRPLVIAGPVGVRARLTALMEAHFPGSSQVPRTFAVEIVELAPGAATQVTPERLMVTGFEVVHPSGTPSMALRIACDGRTVSYTGDTEWTDALLQAGRHADLLIAECYTFVRKVRFHLDYETLREKWPMFAARRLVLTHMSAEMLARTSEVTVGESASDGLEIDIG